MDSPKDCLTLGAIGGELGAGLCLANVLLTIIMLFAFFYTYLLCIIVNYKIAAQCMLVASAAPAATPASASTIVIVLADMAFVCGTIVLVLVLLLFFPHCRL